MNINISYTNDKPMYEQIMDCIRHGIINGEFNNNEMLPSVRQLAKDLNVSMITTKRAYSELENDGFLYTVSGKGTFVKLDSIKDVKNTHNQKLLNSFIEKISELKKFGVQKKEAVDAVEQVYSEDIK